MAHLKIFFVTLNVQCCNRVSASKFLICATNAEIAQDYAITLEADSPKELDWGHRSATDEDGIVYSYGACVQVKPVHAPVMSNYLAHFVVVRSELEESGNWLDTQL